MASTRLRYKLHLIIALSTLLLLPATQGFTSNAKASFEGNGIGFNDPKKDSVSEKLTSKLSKGHFQRAPRLTNEDASVVSPELLQQWKELYSKIREEEKLAQNLFRDATNRQFKAGTQLRNAELKKDMIDPVQIASLQATFDQSVADLKKANLQQKEIKKLIEKARKINSKPGSITEKKVIGIRTAYNDYLARYYPGLPPVVSPVVPTPAPTPPPVPPAAEPSPELQATPAQSQPTSETKTDTQAKPNKTKPTPGHKPETQVTTTQTKPTSQHKPETQEKPAAQNKSDQATPTQPKPAAQTKPTTQVKPKVEETQPKQVESEPIPYDPDMVNKRPGQPKTYQYLSQPYPCIFEIDTFDRASNTNRKALKPGILFTHTDPDLKPYFRGKDLITCLGRISKSGAYVQLTIEFQIASSHSQNNFGTLEEGSLLRFKLMNDESISLFNLKTNMGHIDPYTGYTIFVGQYALGKQEMAKLSTLELDKMRVMWSTGFEDYDVFHVDFLINQLSCIMSK